MMVGMERARRGGVILGTLLGWAGCAGGQTGESPGDHPPAALYAGGDGRCEAEACAGPKPSGEQVQEFSGNASGPTRDYEVFESVAEAVERPELIATGWLIGVEHGRRGYFGDLCVRTEGGYDAETEAPRGPCLEWEPGFSSYVNLVIEAEAVLRGDIPAPAKPLHVELHWPNNLAIDDFVASAPLGARVLIMSEWVDSAQEEAAPLETAGIDAGNLRDNLLWLTPYGLAFEDAEGVVAPAFYGDELALLIDPSGGAVRFDALVSAVSAALE
jgi:hypothetical protein